MPHPEKLPSLTSSTADVGALIARLVEHYDELPASSWKRLYVVALKRMAAMKATRALGHLCAAEAFTVAFHSSWVRDEKDTPGAGYLATDESSWAFRRDSTWREARLTAIELRRITPSTLRRRPGLDDPDTLFLWFQRVRDVLRKCVVCTTSMDFEDVNAAPPACSMKCRVKRDARLETYRKADVAMIAGLFHKASGEPLSPALAASIRARGPIEGAVAFVMSVFGYKNAAAVVRKTLKTAGFDLRQWHFRESRPRQTQRDQ